MFRTWGLNPHLLRSSPITPNERLLSGTATPYQLYIAAVDRDLLGPLRYDARISPVILDQVAHGATYHSSTALTLQCQLSNTLALP